MISMEITQIVAIVPRLKMMRTTKVQ